MKCLYRLLCSFLLSHTPSHPRNCPSKHPTTVVLRWPCQSYCKFVSLFFFSLVLFISAFLGIYSSLYLGTLRCRVCLCDKFMSLRVVSVFMWWLQLSGTAGRYAGCSGVCRSLSFRIRLQYRTIVSRSNPKILCPHAGRELRQGLSQLALALLSPSSCNVRPVSGSVSGLYGDAASQLNYGSTSTSIKCPQMRRRGGYGCVWILSRECA